MSAPTYPAAHAALCPYLEWYNQNARWQPNHPLSLLVREIMVKELCNCVGSPPDAPSLEGACPHS